MNPELMAAVFGVAIILSAIFVKALQKRIENKNHNRAVRPSLVIESEEESDRPIKVILQNSGAGVAYIEQIEIMMDGMLLPANDRDTIKNVLSRLGVSGYDILCYVPAKDETIQPGQRFAIIEANPINEREHSEILAAINRLTFKVRYSSSGDETFVVT